MIVKCLKQLEGLGSIMYQQLIYKLKKESFAATQKFL